ncbi:MAG: hypothetical protein KF784_12990 [Fimbriimonadaceae bacterium]|nr:hypothetical protein [Fimbriimonadaceae bacterium]
MNTSYKKALSIAALAAVGVSTAAAQADWGFQCIDPGNTTARSPDHAVAMIGNNVFRCHVGQSGTITYGDVDGNAPAPCYPAATTGNLAGRIGFMMGTQGSVQDQNPADPANANFTDDLMVLTVGMPFDPSGTYSYATTTKNGVRTLFGANGLGTSFVGASHRYMIHDSTNDGIYVQLRVDLIADTARLQWTLVNLENQINTVGLWIGADIGMITNGSDLNGANQSGTGLAGLTSNPKPAYAVLPGRRPPVTEKRLNRTIDPGTYPDHLDFYFGQTAAAGLRIDTGPTPGTTDESGNSDATQSEEVVLGNKGFITGPAGGDNTFTDSIIGDVLWLGNASYLVKYPETPLAANPNPIASADPGANPVGTRKQIISYVRTPWGVGSYSLPYAAVADAPVLVAENPNGQDGLSPNPMTIRVYVDNIFAYSDVEIGTPLNDVKITLNLPNGLSLAPGELGTKTIQVLGPRQMGSVDFQVEANGVEFGDLPYTIVVDPAGVPKDKTLHGIVRVAATPRVTIRQDSNMISIPWNFPDTAFNTIFAPLQMPVDFQAYTWDPVQNGYIPATSAQRGKSFWIVSNTDEGSVPYTGATTPTDTSTGFPLINLTPGWNMIGNPYNYAIPVSQLVGRTTSTTLTWAQMLTQNVVSGSLVWYDSSIGDYQYLQGLDAFIEPNKGYWVYVFEEFDLDFSSVTLPGLPGSNRSSNNAIPWQQTDKQWRLKLSARTNNSIDAENYIGVAKSQAEARNLTVFEAPMSPTQKVALSTEQMVNGQPTRMAQALIDNKAKREWKVFVTAQEAGEVVLTWPNVSTLPKNVRFRLTDVATGSTRDLKGSSGYTFNMAAAGSREFKLEALAAGAVNAVIGNVVATRPGRGPGDPLNITYTLSSDANTTVRILSGSGREIFTVTRGRSDRAGENTAVWTLRDNANRLVAPGAYRVEILAETEGGERVRKVVPINIIR